MARMLGSGSRRRKLGLAAIAVFLIALIGSIGGYGYYSTFVAPTKILAVRVGDVTHNQGDLVSRLTMQQAASIALGEIFDFGRKPFEVVREVTDAELIRRAAPDFNIRVTEQDIDMVLRQRFYPRVPEGQEFSPGQLEREYEETYRGFLERSHLSHADYSSLVEEEVYRDHMITALGEQVPEEAEQVEVHWVRLPSLIDPRNISSPGPIAEDVRLRLLSEDFGSVAREVSRDPDYSNASGYVGWVPEGAFPFLDHLLFGTEDMAPLEHNQISETVHHGLSPEGIYILKVTAGPEVRELSGRAEDRLKAQALNIWLDEQILLGSNEGWVDVNNTSDLYSWVVDQVRKAAPNATPPAGNQG